LGVVTTCRHRFTWFLKKENSKKQGERERQRHRERDRERQRETERDRDIERETERDRERQRETETEVNGAKATSGEGVGGTRLGCYSCGRGGCISGWWRRRRVDDLQPEREVVYWTTEDELAHLQVQNPHLVLAREIPYDHHRGSHRLW